MTMPARPLNVAAILIALFLAACGGERSAPTDSQSFITEQTGANTFKNDHFALTVEKPESWHALTLEQQEQLFGMGADLASSGNADMKKLMDVSAKRLQPLFAFFKHELGTPVPFNPNVLALAENASFMPGMKTGEDYFYQSKKLMLQKGINYEFGEQYSKRTIGGVVFDVMDVTMNFNGASVKQKYYAARHGDYFVSLIESYTSDEQRAATSEIIDSIQLDW